MTLWRCLASHCYQWFLRFPFVCYGVYIVVFMVFCFPWFALVSAGSPWFSVVLHGMQLCIPRVPVTWPSPRKPKITWKQKQLKTNGEPPKEAKNIKIIKNREPPKKQETWKNKLQQTCGSNLKMSVLVNNNSSHSTFKIQKKNSTQALPMNSHCITKALLRGY